MISQTRYGEFKAADVIGGEQHDADQILVGDERHRFQPRHVAQRHGKQRERGQGGGQNPWDRPAEMEHQDVVRQQRKSDRGATQMADHENIGAQIGAFVFAKLLGQEPVDKSADTNSHASPPCAILLRPVTELCRMGGFQPKVRTTPLRGNNRDYRYPAAGRPTPIEYDLC